jgi:hypothetical protein
MTRPILRVGFITESESSEPVARGSEAPREPEFIVDGWAYFAINALDTPGPTSTGDASFGPAGSTKEWAGLVWEVGAGPRVDFERTSHGLMLYVTISRPVENWKELQEQLLASMPDIKAAWSKRHEAL